MTFMSVFIFSNFFLSTNYICSSFWDRLTKYIIYKHVYPLIFSDLCSLSSSQRRFLDTQFRSNICFSTLPLGILKKTDRPRVFCISIYGSDGDCVQHACSAKSWFSRCQKRLFVFVYILFYVLYPIKVFEVGVSSDFDILVHSLVHTFNSHFININPIE